MQNFWKGITSFFISVLAVIGLHQNLKPQVQPSAAPSTSLSSITLHTTFPTPSLSPSPTSTPGSKPSPTPNCANVIEPKAYQNCLNSSPMTFPKYSDSECKTQILAILPQAENDYQNWYKDWQNARAGLSSCYTQKSVPECDKLMSAINLDWNDKIGNILASYQKKIAVCDWNKFSFGQFSKIIP